MDNKDLITRFAEDGFRFEALHQEVDSLIAEADSEILAYEYRRTWPTKRRRLF